MPVQTISNTPRRYCEDNNGCLSRRYLNRTQEGPQHHIRTDRIGSQHNEWRRKDTLDLQCATQHTKEVTRDREDQLWATARRNRKWRTDPLANVVGWYSGHLDHTPWIERKVRCYRRIRPASELRNKKKHSMLRQAYQNVKAQREAEEGESANALTAHEHTRLRTMVNDASFLASIEAKKAEEEASNKKEEREEELKGLLAILTTVVPVAVTPEPSPATTPLQMHPHRMAQLAPPTLLQAAAPTKTYSESQAELRHRRALKQRRAKAKMEGRPFEEDDMPAEGSTWQAPEYKLDQW